MTENEAAGRMLPGFAEDIVVVSSDGPLIKRSRVSLAQKIGHANLKVVSPQSFFKGKTA